MTATPLNLLVVEDDAEDFDLLHRSLDRMPGFRCSVAWARNYGDARRRIETKPFDAMLVDYNLDGGYTALDVIGTLRDPNAFTPAIVMTAMSQDVDLGIAEAGAVDYIQKGQYSSLDLERALRHAVDRKQVQRRLRQTEDRFRGLVDVLGQMVWVTDAKGRPLDTSNWSDLTGQGSKAIAEAQEFAWLEYIHPQDAPTVRKRWRDSMDTGTPYEVCCRIRMRDGTYRWFQAQMVALRDNSGTIREWIGVAVDIDDRQRIADALLLANERLMALVSAYREIAAAGLDRSAIARCAAQAVKRLLVNADLVAVAQPAGAWLEYFNVVGVTPPPTPVRVPMDASLAGWCASRRQSLICDDVATDPRAARPNIVPDFHAALAVPLVAGDELVGVVTASSRRVAAFDAADLRTLELLGGMLSYALANAVASEQRQQLLADRTEALDKLRTSEEVFRALAEHSDEMINILNADGTIRYTSPSITRVLGWQPGELNGTRPLELVHPEDRRRVVMAWQRLLRQAGDSAQVAARLRHKDGSWRHIEGSVRNLLCLSAIEGMTCNARDVTRRVEADRAKEFQSQLLQTVEQAVIATDLAGTATYVNAYAERQYGWAVSEIVGKPVNDLIVPIDQRDRMAAIIARVAAGESFSGEFELQRRDGSRFTAFATNTPIRDAAGSIVGYLSVARDITEMRSLEAQLRQSQKMNAVGQLAGGVAHDFNNLLTAIFSYSELLLEDIAVERHREDLVEIQGAARRAADLTKQLLAFSRNQVLRPEHLDACDVMRGMEKMLRRLISEDVELVMTYAPEGAPVLADRSQLEQVLLNLVLNARDALGSGGRIEVRIRRELSGDETVVALEVEDNGCGMSPETLGRIFEPFYTTKAVGKGTGLGLSVVYGNVQQLEGTVDVVSSVGHGSTFVVKLPLAHIDQAAALEPAVSSMARGNETVLLVEDDPYLLELSRRVLLQNGYRVISASLPREALAQVNHSTGIDVVVTDMVMPEMNGRTMVQQLADRGLAPRVLFMSGYSDENLRTDPATESTAFLPKPWTPRELARAVRQLLDRAA